MKFNVIIIFQDTTPYKTDEISDTILVHFIGVLVYGEHKII